MTIFKTSELWHMKTNESNVAKKPCYFCIVIILNFVWFLYLLCKHKETTDGILKLVIFHQESGQSVRNITKLIKLSHLTIQHVIKRIKKKIKLKTIQEKAVRRANST